MSYFGLGSALRNTVDDEKVPISPTTVIDPTLYVAHLVRDRTKVFANYPHYLLRALVAK